MSYPNLKAEMARSSITQDQLAMAAGVSTRSVSKWLNKDCEMGVGKALRIQRELFPEIEPSYLFRYEPSGK